MIQQITSKQMYWNFVCEFQRLSYEK